jgi:hypothetical protein
MYVMHQIITVLQQTAEHCVDVFKSVRASYECVIISVELV